MTGNGKEMAAIGEGWKRSHREVRKKKIPS